MGSSMGGMPMGGADALVFNEMGIPVGNLSSFGMGMGSNIMGSGMLPGMAGGMGGMQPGVSVCFPAACPAFTTIAVELRAAAIALQLATRQT